MMRPRDMTRAEFKAALARRGFRGPIIAWFEDTTGATPGVSYSGVYTRKGKLLRRTTIAHLIRSRDAEIAKQGKAP
jgi:hypothetical protein